MSTKYRINPLTMNLDMISDGESGAVKQKLNPLTGNFDMVGEGEVKMKLNPLTSNFDMVSEGGGGGGLPDAYQEVEYIESSGTQYINTGFQYTQTTGKVEAKFIPTVLGGDYPTYRLAGAYNGSNRSFIMYNGVDPAYIGIGGNDYSTSIAMSANTLYEVAAEITTPGTVNYTLNGNTANISYTGSLATSRDYLLFCNNEDGTPGNYGQYKLFYYKMYEAGTLVRDFVPCYRKVDNVAGLYDLVEGVFYTNQGTGEFIIPSSRQPGVNTIAYRPLTEDLDDVTGNYNLSAIGNYYSFTTNQQGKACCELNPQDSNDTYFSTGQSPSSVFDFANNDYTFVCSLCDASSTVSGARSGASIFSLGPQFKGPNIDTYESIGSSTGGREFADSISHTGPDVAYDFTQSDFKTIISVWNHTTQTFSYYVDGVLNAEDENTGSFNGFSNFYLCVDQYDMSDAARRYHGKIRDIIIENKARTAQEISDYCSQN